MSMLLERLMSLPERISLQFGSTPLIVCLALLGFTLIAFHTFSPKTKIPTVNSYAGDWTRSCVKSEYAQNAKELLEAGLNKFPDQPFKIITALTDRVILPHSYLDWMRTHRDLDHQAQVAEEFFGAYPGFEPIGAFNDPNHFLIDLVKKRMSSITAPMLDTWRREADAILEECLGDRTEYHTIPWPSITYRLITMLSSSIFVGPRLSRDPQWNNLISSFTLNIFNAARTLRSWPASLRPLVHWFLPDCRKCRAQISEGRAIMARFTPGSEEENTVFGWTSDQGSKIDHAVIQLALAAGAMHTTTQLLQQSVLDLAFASTEKPDVISNLRSEISGCFEEFSSNDNGERGMTVSPQTFGQRLTLLDSCIKETQRLKPGLLVNIERLTLKPVTLPNGTIIPKGTHLAVPCSPQWSLSLWDSDASAWNPFRFTQPDNNTNQDITSKPQSKNRNALIQSDNRHYAWGTGRFICPGRFFVAGEIKMILARLVQGWDIKLTEESLREVRRKGVGRVETQTRGFGFEMMADERVGVEVRRRVV